MFRVKLIADIVDKEENQVWTKKTFFSQYEPDWAQLKKVGMKINTDLAVLISIRIDTTSEVDVFLYDFKQAKAYSRENRVISYNDVPDGVRQNVLQTLKGIFRRP